MLTPGAGFIVADTDPTPQSGLDVERLARALVVEGYPWDEQNPPGWRNRAEAERIAAEYGASVVEICDWCMRSRPEHGGGMDDDHCPNRAETHWSARLATPADSTGDGA